MSESRSALWISVLLSAGLVSGGNGYCSDRMGGTSSIALTISKHSRPLVNPSNMGFLQRLPLINPGLASLYPFPVQLFRAPGGYWLAAGNDLYKLSPQGLILNHVIYPYDYHPNSGPPMISYWNSIAPIGDGQFYALVTKESVGSTTSLLFFDNDGTILNQWEMQYASLYGHMVATADSIYTDFDNHDLLILSHDGQFKHRMHFNAQDTAGLSGLWQDAMGQAWVGGSEVVLDGESLEVRMFRIDPEGLVGPAYALKPQFTYPMPNPGAAVKDMVPLPDGGFVIGVQMAYMDPNKPYDQRWKYFAYLAEIGPDGAARWCQLYQDLYLVSLVRNASGALWAEGYLMNGPYLEKALLMHFSRQGVFDWGMERAEPDFYDVITGHEIAAGPDGSLAMGWTREGFQQLWFGVLDSSKLADGCDTIHPSDIGDRWMGPVGMDVQPVVIEPVELSPVETWEEPTELWQGEGEVSDYCRIGIPTPKKKPADP